jgi:hypothetical protein
MEDDAHRCLYIGTPWAEEAIADHHDVDEFKEASRMIGWVLLCRGILHGLISSFVCSFLQSLADQAQARVGLLRKAANDHAEVAVAREATLQAQIEAV